MGQARSTLSPRFQNATRAVYSGDLVRLLAYIQRMRRITLLLLFPSLALGQALHEFSNGDVADAEKINQNFNYVIENASGGCTATQQDNSVIIECADGTTGVLAGAGTVVAYPEGVIGESYPVDTIEVGEPVLEDANGVILGPVRDGVFGTYFSDVKDKNGERVCHLVWDSDLILAKGAFAGGLYYESQDCTGSPLTDGFGIRACVWQDSYGWMTAGALLGGSVVYQSVRSSDGTCSISNGLLDEAAIAAGLGLPPELLEIAYPVSLGVKQ